VAFNNGSLGMIRLEMMVSGYPSFETDHGVADLATVVIERRPPIGGPPSHPMDRRAGGVP
jgi:hypothetical protein